MPGGRLTHADRQRIAAGLTAGLGFAEIARQLGKPTSTVSREVGRNGGPAEYRADRAHLATAQRARRPRMAVRATVLPLPVADAPGRDAVAVRDFRERFAGLMLDTGLPRMAARVLACLVVTDSGTQTTAELIAQLRVSPASVSKAVANLTGQELVRRERAPGGRHERYTVDDEVWLGSWSRNGHIDPSWVQAAREGAELLDPATPAGARLHAMGTHLTGPGPVVLADGLTVLAALLQAGRPLSTCQLAAALDWPPDRVGAALRDAAGRPDVTDPVALCTPTPDTYAAVVAPDRLTDRQRAALNGSGPR